MSAPMASHLGKGQPCWKFVFFTLESFMTSRWPEATEENTSVDLGFFLA